MSINTELDDTARMRGGSMDLVDQSGIDDTARLYFSSRASGSKQGQTRGVHEFAQGIIRFYRARSILHNDCGFDGCRRAWAYLKPLGPWDMPPESRRKFLELAYCIGRQSSDEAFESLEFQCLVLDIADAIDTFVDQINHDVDS